jgi:hypothetical protein
MVADLLVGEVIFPSVPPYFSARFPHWNISRRTALLATKTSMEAQQTKGSTHASLPLLCAILPSASTYMLLYFTIKTTFLNILRSALH